MANDVANDIIEEHSLSSLLLDWFALKKGICPGERREIPMLFGFLK